MNHRIRTERLELVPSTAELAQAEIGDGGGFANLLEAIVPEDWPPPFNDADSMQFNADRLREAPDQAGWRAWYFVKPDPASGDRRLIGIAGFFGPPSPEGEAELGYSLMQPYQRQGYGTEAVRALVQLAFEHPNVTRVVAHTLPELTASIRLLEKLGFRLVGPGEEEGSIRFELRRAERENNSPSTKPLRHSNS